MMRIPVAHKEQRNEWVLQFINIVFLILLFFLVNATIQAPPPQGISPPISIRTEVTAPPVGALFVDRVGSVYWNGKQVLVQSLAAMQGNRPRALYVDKNLQARKLIALVAALQQVGLAGLPLVTVKSAP